MSTDNQGIRQWVPTVNGVSYYWPSYRFMVWMTMLTNVKLALRDHGVRVVECAVDGGFDMDGLEEVRFGMGGKLGQGTARSMLIPTHADHRFRFKLITDSDACRSRIPTCRSVIPTCRSRIPMHADHSGVSE